MCSLSLVSIRFSRLGSAGSPLAADRLMSPSKPPLTFETDAAIIDRLGRELVARQETALIELVKNSFDADATKVDVVFLAKAGITALEVRDNGAGMTRDELVDGFLRLASDLKV